MGAREREIERHSNGKEDALIIKKWSYANNNNKAKEIYCCKRDSGGEDDDDDDEYENITIFWPNVCSSINSYIFFLWIPSEDLLWHLNVKMCISRGVNTRKLYVFFSLPTMMTTTTTTTTSTQTTTNKWREKEYNKKNDACRKAMVCGRKWNVCPSWNFDMIDWNEEASNRATSEREREREWKNNSRNFYVISKLITSILFFYAVLC